MQAKVSENKHSSDTRLTLLEYRNINIESLILELKNGQNRLETKVDSLFLHFDKKLDASDNKTFNLFMILGGIIIGVFLIVGKKVFGI